MIEIIDIQVPDFNDSFTKINIDNTEFWLRFTWNETSQNWHLGIYTIDREPIVQMLKIVPKFPLTLNYIDSRLPSGIFGVYTDLLHVRRKDFVENNATFSYIHEV